MKKPVVKINIGTGPAPEIAAHYFYSVQFIAINTGVPATSMNGNFWTADDIYVSDIIDAVLQMASDTFNHPSYRLDQVMCQIVALNNIDLPRHVMDMQQALKDDRRLTEIEILELVSKDVTEILCNKSDHRRLAEKLELMKQVLAQQIAALKGMPHGNHL